MEMQFLGVPGVDEMIFFGLSLAAFCTSLFGLVTGTAGGLLLLGIMSLVFPPAVLIPVHTVVQMGVGTSRVVIMWRYVMRGSLPPFLIGAVIGAGLGAQIFITLPVVALQGILGLFIILFTWAPRISRIGSERKRFALMGFIASFLGMFVSATGTLISPILAHSSPDRRNYAATFAAMMAMVHVCKLVAFGFLGVALAAYLPLMAAMIVAAAIGNWVGSRVIARVPERAFRMILQGLLTVLALRLLWRAAVDGGLL